eukprot:3793741-Amphidinium_carterae.2
MPCFCYCCTFLRLLFQTRLFGLSPQPGLFFCNDLFSLAQHEAVLRFGQTIGMALSCEKILGCAVCLWTLCHQWMH